MKSLVVFFVLLSSALTACGDAASPEPLSATHVQGTWAFQRTAAPGCAVDITLNVTAVDPKPQGKLEVAGYWWTFSDAHALNFVGSVESETGLFEIALLAVPREWLRGTMHAEGTATATLAKANCTAEMSGRRR